jgi:hypothetical protein
LDMSPRPMASMRASPPLRLRARFLARVLS